MLGINILIYIKSLNYFMISIKVEEFIMMIKYK